jgi:TATA-box binding protein (TBP) (component of TFIID and TFIIIB)
MIVNKIQSFQISCQIKYEQLDEYFATKNYSSRPKMKKITLNSSTILIFPTMKARIMGTPSNQLETIDQLRCRLKANIFNLKVQSMTIVHNIGHPINLDELQKHPKFNYEPELFCAAYSSTLKNIPHINIFHSGKVVITGVKTTYPHEALFNSHFWRRLITFTKHGYCA